MPGKMPTEVVSLNEMMPDETLSFICSVTGRNGAGRSVARRNVAGLSVAGQNVTKRCVAERDVAVLGVTGRNVAGRSLAGDRVDVLHEEMTLRVSKQ